MTGLDLSAFHDSTQPVAQGRVVGEAVTRHLLVLDERRITPFGSNTSYGPVNVLQRIQNRRGSPGHKPRAKTTSPVPRRDQLSSGGLEPIGSARGAAR
jgi:hypothetical protein